MKSHLRIFSGSLHKAIHLLTGHVRTSVPYKEQIQGESKTQRLELYMKKCITGRVCMFNVLNLTVTVCMMINYTFRFVLQNCSVQMN